MNCESLESGGIPGELGGNRTRDNLIKSHEPFPKSQTHSAFKTVKPPTGGQWLAARLSNLLAARESRQPKDTRREF